MPFGSNVNGGFWGAPSPMSYTQYQLYCERLLKEFASTYRHHDSHGQHQNPYAATKSREITSFVAQYWRDEYRVIQAGQQGYRPDRRQFPNDNH